MRTLFKSDLIRNLVAGFAMGAAALVALTPATGTETLRTTIESIVKA